MGLYATIQSASIGLEIMDKDIIRLQVEGNPGIGKKQLLEKISAFLNDEGFSVTEPTRDRCGLCARMRWSIDILNFKDTS